MTSEPVDLQHISFEGKERGLSRPRLRTPAAFSVATRSVAARRVEDPAADRFARWVLARSGLDAAVYLGQPLQRRVPACLRALRARSADDARRLLERRPDLLATAVSTLLINVTEFWRDAAVFDDVGARVMPALAGQNGRLHVWSAGCSSGAELYTTAILVDEAGLLARTTLLGTDCRADAIAEAREGRYLASALDGVSEDRRRRHFDATGGRWRPGERLRQRVRWQISDLSRHIEPGPWDLILCRNVAIYLSADAAAQMFAGLAAVLRPGGFLVVGKAERPPARIGLVSVRRCVYRRMGDQHGPE